METGELADKERETPYESHSQDSDLSLYTTSSFRPLSRLYFFGKTGPRDHIFVMCSWISCLGSSYVYCGLRR